MKLTLFAKSKTSKEGRQFYTYFTKMKKKSGDELTVEVKFREKCGVPEKFPCNIIVAKEDANFSTKEVTYKDNEGVEKIATNNRLWINAWTMGEPYVDHSLDDFDLD